MTLNLSKDDQAAALHSLQRYLREELDLEASELQAGFLLEYFLKEFGPFAYNQGVEDAKQFFLAKAEDLAGTCFEEGLTYWKEAPGAKQVRRKP